MTYLVCTAAVHGAVAKGVNWNSRAWAILDIARFIELLYVRSPFSFLGIEEAALIDDEVQASLDLWHSFRTALPKST